MDILIAEPMAMTKPFLHEMRRHCPDARLIAWRPDMVSLPEPHALVAFKLPDEMEALPSGIKAIFCFGAGTGHITADPRVPDEVIVARMLDEGQAEQMLDYALHAALARLLDDQHSLATQMQRKWDRPLVARPRRNELTVTVLGQGHIGAHISRGLQQAGFCVRRWTRNFRAGDTDIVFGLDTIEDVCRGADVLISVLPPSAEIANILTTRLFLSLNPGAYFVNLGRGEHVDDSALIAALDSGHLGAALLDVFRQEPLPADDSYWLHPRVRVTPHRSGLPTVKGAAKSLADFIIALSQGTPIPGLVRP